MYPYLEEEILRINDNMLISWYLLEVNSITQKRCRAPIH